MILNEFTSYESGYEIKFSYFNVHWMNYELYVDAFNICKGSTAIAVYDAVITY
jgi:hypothetical protein